MGDNAAEDAAVTEVLVDVEIMAIRTVMTIKNKDLDAAKVNVIQIIVEGVATIIHTEDEEDNGMEMTQITVTEIIGTEIMMVKEILTGVDDGTIIVEVKDIVIVEEVDDGILVSNIMTLGTASNPNFKTQITIDRLQWDINTDTQSHIVKVCPWCGVGLLRLFFLCCGVISKLTLLLVLAAPVKRKGARGEVRFPGDPATMCPVLFKGSRSLLLLACCYVPIGGRMLIFKGGT